MQEILISGVASVFPGGQIIHPDDQNEEENQEILRKNEGKYSETGKVEEIFLCFPPRSVKLATALVVPQPGMMLDDPLVVSRSGLMEEDPLITPQPVKILIAGAMGVLHSMKKTSTVLNVRSSKCI